MQGGAGAAQVMTQNPGAQVYMAPETQNAVSMDKQRAKYGAPADCYSFGVVVLAMLLRREPSLFTLATHGRAHDIQSLKTDHPMYLVVVQCLKDEPPLRPSAAKLCEMLQIICSKMPTVKPCVTPRKPRATNSSNGAQQHAEGARDSVARQDFLAVQKELQEAKQSADQQYMGLKEEFDRLTMEHQSAQQEAESSRLSLLRLEEDMKRLQADRQRLVNERDEARIQLQHHTSTVARQSTKQYGIQELVRDCKLSSTAGTLARSQRLFTITNKIPDISVLPKVRCLLYLWFR